MSLVGSVEGTLAIVVGMAVPNGVEVGFVEDAGSTLVEGAIVFAGFDEGVRVGLLVGLAVGRVGMGVGAAVGPGYAHVKDLM